MPSSLKDFYLNEVMRNDVKEYLTQFLKEEALKRLFDETYDAPKANPNLYGFTEAKTLVDKAFENLEVLFSPKSEGKEIINGSR